MVEANPVSQVRLARKQEINASKTMSYILRHGAEKEGIQMRADGYIYLQDLLNVPALKRMRIGVAEVEYIVANNEKKRFEMTEE